ncbi:hypothetical protein F5B22DRAFT_649599 [Xylaria bambusicola]|uniref:uncharacterized protein n=1 Tax=Xylaria bambusicola TaxID=326684 RepID=UPI0020077C06|nr:uncharacterized protein F5B22DRAFT_649599 [Xylaria bambusicola]KAI0508900.1 hypothetical protein F5B22DRAFT_649599 [Xylaria bambusicola]
MMQSRDTDILSGSGHTAIVVSMIVFVSLLLLSWATMGTQIYRARKQANAGDPDVEAEAGTAMPDGTVPLEDLLKRGQTKFQTRSAQGSRASISTWPRTEVSTNAPSSKSGGERISAWRRFIQNFKKEEEK